MCKTDSDGDRILDRNDNCPDDPNEDQADQDDDGVGDTCNNCPVPNPGQIDENANDLGDVCDELIAVLGPFLPPPGPQGLKVQSAPKAPPGPLIPACPDADGDAWAACVTEPTCHPYGHPCGDCDDADPRINPAAPPGQRCEDEEPSGVVTPRGKLLIAESLPES